jgi:hypothetical protein
MIYDCGRNEAMWAAGMAQLAPKENRRMRKVFGAETWHRFNKGAATRRSEVSTTLADFIAKAGTTDTITIARAFDMTPKTAGTVLGNLYGRGVVERVGFASMKSGVTHSRVRVWAIGERYQEWRRANAN